MAKTIMQNLDNALQPFGIVEGNPSVSLVCVGLQKSPLGSTGAVCHLNDVEHALSGIYANLVMVRAGASADIQIIIA